MKALVIGSAACMADDIAAALALFEPDIIVACNQAAASWAGRLDHLCSMHAELLDQFLADRAANGHAPPGHVWTAEHRAKRAKDANTQFKTIKSAGGSSGMLCVRVARHVGATRIVLAGMPMTRDGAHFHNASPWAEAKLYQRVWIEQQDDLRRDTRSMSGLTRALLGVPDAGWLAGMAAA